MAIRYSNDTKPSMVDAIGLCRSVAWPSADKPAALQGGLLASHSLMTAWEGESLVGLGNAISDGHLVVYFPHLVVHPDYQGQGIGSALMNMMMSKYRGFHQQALLADGRAIDFYKKLGFTRAGLTEPLWIFDGHEHD
jgi:ribosomal protein S18 acetylase RimI-like enzyme